MNAILSIKPVYVRKIISKEKKFEYRKKIFQQPIEEILIYSSSPEKRIIGKFKYDGFYEDTPQRIWEKTHIYSGIPKEFFFEYFVETRVAFAIIIKDLYVFKKPIDPFAINPNFKPPQSFMYINTGDFK